MPIREYVCQACGNKLERLQRLSDDPLTDCPECGESALEKKISAVGFRLSGGGWYETDFKSEGRRNVSGDSEQSGASTSDTSNPNGQSNSSSGSGGNDQAAASGKSDQSTSGQSSAGSKESAGKSEKQSSSGQAGKDASGSSKPSSQSNSDSTSG